MQVFLFVTVGWVFSVCLHEFGHALVAFRGGDYSVREKGYLTLNPVNYTDPMYSLVIPLVFLFLGGIGLPGGAVYIEERLLRSRGWRTGCALAGPFMNLALIFLLCLPFWMGAMNLRFGPSLAFLLQLEICAVLLNLLPIPPLDGFRALAPWLPEEVSARMLAASNAFFWALILVLWFMRPANLIFWGLVHGAMDALGVDVNLAQEGWREFQFWRQ